MSSLEEGHPENGYNQGYDAFAVLASAGRLDLLTDMLRVFTRKQQHYL